MRARYLASGTIGRGRGRIHLSNSTRFFVPAARFCARVLLFCFAHPDEGWRSAEITLRCSVHRRRRRSPPQPHPLARAAPPLAARAPRPLYPTPCVQDRPLSPPPPAPPRFPCLSQTHRCLP